MGMGKGTRKRTMEFRKGGEMVVNGGKGTMGRRRVVNNGGEMRGE